MAQFIPFSPNVEVNGQTILSFLNAIPHNAFAHGVLKDTLKKYNLQDIEPNSWYSQRSWLDAFAEISKKFGKATLFSIGKAIPENAIFPPQINDLESALKGINMAYHMNHRNGDIGYYKLLSFDKNHKKAIMECKNPYPSDFDRGIIITMVRKFIFKSSKTIQVELDTSKPTRLGGADSCTYIITW
ncbi:hypothetical protein ACE193_07865 [Bernardetia sp. OM2101]|uniref:hypothetical protein n=1 Tax=Bernardetia sp. OM2101 TaxID=3344876 RepID=UPI0035CFECD1